MHYCTAIRLSAVLNSCPVRTSNHAKVHIIAWKRVKRVERMRAFYQKKKNILNTREREREKERIKRSGKIKCSLSVYSMFMWIVQYQIVKTRNDLTLSHPSLVYVCTTVHENASPNKCGNILKGRWMKWNERKANQRALTSAQFMATTFVEYIAMVRDCCCLLFYSSFAPRPLPININVALE